jgi:hypothetical protein
MVEGLLSLVVALVGMVSFSPAGQLSLVPLQPTPIGRGPMYRPPPGAVATSGAPIGRFRCGPAGPTGDVAHVEVFARGRVVIIPPGVGVGSPQLSGASVVGGRCRYPVSTADPTGVVQVARGVHATLGSLFAIWGQPLGGHRVCGFRSRRPVVVYVDGRRWAGRARAVPLHPYSEVVVEIGRRVPPHTTYLFPESAP